MKTVTGKIVSTKPVNLSKAANILSNFVSSDNGASQPVTAYLRRASAAFNELVYFKKHHTRKKISLKEEASNKSDISHRSLEEEEVRVLENGGLNKNFGQDSVEVEGKLRKKEKKKEDSLGSGENVNIEVELKEGNEMMKEKNEEKKKKKKKKEGSLGSGENDNIEVELKEGNEMMNENNEEKKKKKKRKNK